MDIQSINTACNVATNELYTVFSLMYSSDEYDCLTCNQVQKYTVDIRIRMAWLRKSDIFLFLLLEYDTLQWTPNSAFITNSELFGVFDEVTKALGFIT